MSRAVIVAILLAAGTAAAQPGAAKPPPGWKPPVITGGGLVIDGRLRGVNMMYFLERASEELDRARLERRSFIPELVRTLDEAPL